METVIQLMSTAGAQIHLGPMLGSLKIVLMGVLALGLLIFVHELGHFAVAKWSGIKVLKFSLGFGKTIFGFTHKGTEYVISALPLGGFVKMAGENPHEVEPGVKEKGDYFSKPWWIRLLVLLAGPGMNLLTAALILGILYWVGFNVPIAKPQIVQVAPASPAATAGLKPGDVIVGLDNRKTDNWEKFSDQLNQAAAQASGQPLHLDIVRDGRTQLVTITPSHPTKTSWKMGVAIAPAATTVIDRVIVGTPAELAGLKKGDRILAVENHPVWSKYDFQKLLWPRADKPTTLQVQRGSSVFAVKLTPLAQEYPNQGKVGVIGVGFKASDRESTVHYPFFTAMSLGLGHTWSMSRMILVSLGQMVTGKLSVKDSLGGPITIMRMAGQEARSGFKDFLFFISGISIMLAILNLLPIPVLDGGSVAFFLIEGLRGKPVSLKIQERAQQVGFLFLIALMLFATANDIYKWVLSAFGG